MQRIFKRFYDKKAYNALKRQNKKSEASVDFEEIKYLLSTYSLGVKGPVYGIAQISKLWDRQLKGSFNFPVLIQNNQNSNSVIAVLANVFL